MPATNLAQEPEVDASDLPPINVGRGGFGQGAPSFTGSPAPGTDIDPGQDKVSAGVANIAGQRAREDAGALSSFSHGINDDVWRTHRAYDAEAATSHDIPSWNEQQQKEKFATDPVKAFGSVGSVFAMVAAAFTHRPMINALQGSAAAMDAVREGDEKSYKDAYTAWKANTDLALKRHDMMHQEYQDAEALMKTDIAAGNLQMALIARKYDDKQTQFLAENGLNEDLLKLKEQRIKTAEETRKYRKNIEEDTIANTVHEQMVGQINKAFEGRPKDDPQRIGLLAEADRRYLHTLQGGKTTLMEDQQWQTIIQWEQQHAKDRNGEGPTAEERQKFLQGFRLTGAALAGGAGSTMTKATGALEEGYYKENIEKGMSDTEARADAIKRAKEANAPPITGNRREALEAHIGQFDEADILIDRVTGTLDRYIGAAGVAGKATRLGERINNLAGGSKTDRVQLMRDVSELQLLAPRLLLDQSTGRPLSAEASHISDVIAGLSAGDTTANTLRAMKEIKAQLARMKTRQKERLGEPAPAGQAPTPDKPKAAPWQNDPEVHSDAMPDPVRAGQQEANYRGQNTIYGIQKDSGQWRMLYDKANEKAGSYNPGEPFSVESPAGVQWFVKTSDGTLVPMEQK